MTNQQNNSPPLTDKQLSQRITAAQSHLHQKLSQIHIPSLNLSDYNQRYLGEKIANLKGILQLYGKLLFLTLKDSTVPIEKFVLVDYGGGTGLFSFLAAELGVGTVIYADIYDVSCSDAQRLSKAIGLMPQHIVCGDIDELAEMLHQQSIHINAITSYDVLEHIYDVPAHFDKLATLPGNGLRVVYGSGANIENPFTVRRIQQSQLRVELQNSDKQWGHKERDTLQSYLQVRAEMIARYAPELPPQTIDQLATDTRGLMQQDIHKYVDEFRETGRISYQPDHPTNTCDPHTGNWCEHLMPFDWLTQLLRSKGYSVEILSGRYNSGGAVHKQIIKMCLNLAIDILGRKGMLISPYYVLLGEYPAKHQSI